MISLFEPHKFWDSQPVPKSTDSLTLGTEHFNMAIETVKDVNETPTALPAEYEWDSLDLNEPKVLEEVYQLLVRNYVEDTEAMFRFDYTKEFL